MIRSQTVLMCAIGALIASTLSFGLAPQQGQDPQIAALQQKVTALEEKLKSYDVFMEAQLKAGKTLADALARSEAEGFTAGINPRSREILLAGLRAQAEAMQTGVVSDDDDDDGPPDDGRRGRRRGK